MSEPAPGLRRRILGIGVAALDLINEVGAYPGEDDEVRALAQRVRRGGNIANTLVALSQLGHACAWAGTFAADAQSREILRDLKRYGIDTGSAVRHPGGGTPTSYVTLSRANGSRTIVHWRDLPELAAADLARVDLSRFDWVHFEGRNPPETSLMVQDCRARRPDLRTSLEVEKPRPGIEHLLEGPEVVIFSRSYVLGSGCGDPEHFLSEQWPRTSARLLVVPWGDKGAYAQLRGRGVCFSPPHSPPTVVDTLGAGDLFNAAVIDGLLAGLDLQTLLARANRLAGYKCGLRGLDGVVAGASAEGLL